MGSLEGLSPACQELHRNFCSCHSSLEKWYQSQVQISSLVFASSYDIRDAGFKIAPVDANVYPAGFNNICPNDLTNVSSLVQNFLHSKYGGPLRKILLLAESHSQNPYYWDNVITLVSLIQAAGYQVRVGMAKRNHEPGTIRSATQGEIQVGSAFFDEEWVTSFAPDLVLSNNDFSEELVDWAAGVSVPIEPVREMGWFQRKKSRHFYHYNRLAKEFSELAGIDPFYLQVHTELFENFDEAMEKKDRLLVDRVDAMIEGIASQYRERKISTKPSVFIKNNSGTYGLGVQKVDSGAELMEWNYKSRKKMKASKGGRGVSDVILQEGIPTRVRADGVSSEPVIYMVGSNLAGGFLRTHSEKSEFESLNSPGAVFKKLCVSDLKKGPEDAPLENVYGWTSRLALLAISLELKDFQDSALRKPSP